MGAATFPFWAPGHWAGMKEFVPLVKDCCFGNNPWGSSHILKVLLRLHLDFWNGIGSATADQIACESPGVLEGKVAVVTGANSGIGAETARVLLKHGCKVIMACRTASTGHEVLDEFSKELGVEVAARGKVMQLDLSDLDSVKNFAMAFNKLGWHLHFIIANAGVMCLPKFEASKQGHEMQFASNHLGHYLLARLLEPKLLETGSATSPARLIFISSAGHDFWENKGHISKVENLKDQVPPTRAYDPMMIYGLTKALNIMTAAQFQRRWGVAGNGVAVSVMPGLIKTKLLRRAAGLEAIFMGPLYGWAHKSIPQGASTTLYCVTAPSVPAEARRETVAYYSNNSLDHGLRYLNANTLDESVAAEVWRLSEALVAPWL